MSAKAMLDLRVSHAYHWLMNNPVAFAIDHVGSAVELARIIGVSAPAIHEWKAGGRPVPIERCVQIERATDGAVRRWDLRPDDWWRIWPELIGADGAPEVPAEERAA